MLGLLCFIRPEAAPQPLCPHHLTLLFYRATAPTHPSQTSTRATNQVLIFVSSRRQTRLTALDLLAYAAADDRPRAFLHMTGEAVRFGFIVLPPAGHMCNMPPRTVAPVPSRT